MNISQVKPILSTARLADDSVLLEGLHGIGKSEIVKQYCIENGYHYTALFLSHQEVGDLIGIPVTEMINGENVTLWSKPVWLQRMTEVASKGKHCVLLLDELNRAQTDVLNSALQLVLERQIHEHSLPTVDGIKTQVIACINPTSEGDYQVQEIDPALLDRFLKLEVEVDTEGWLNWARENNVNKIVRDFILNNPTKLHFIPEDQNDIGPTPRSWAKLGAFIDNFNKFNKLDKELDKEHESILFNIIRGKVGSSIGAQFYTFYNEYNYNINTEDIEKFIKKEWLKQKEEGVFDPNVLGKKVKELTKDMEGVIKLEHANTLYNKYKDKFTDPISTSHTIIPLLGLLYSFEIEILTSFLKDKKTNDEVNFYRMMKLDFNKQLALKIKNKIQNPKIPNVSNVSNVSKYDHIHDCMTA